MESTTWREAQRNLVDRTGVDDIRYLVATLIQTDRFGTSVQALRVHSDSLRTERRQRADEQAAKTTIKKLNLPSFTEKWSRLLSSGQKLLLV